MAKKAWIRNATALFCALTAMTLTACNESDAQRQLLGDDWVQNTLPTPPPEPGSSPTPAPTPADGVYTGPAEAAKYVQKFIDDALIQGVNVLPDMQNPKLEIRIASLDAWGSSTIGLCETGTNQRRVTFDPDYWNSASDLQKELVTHHELGHCILYRGHRSDFLSNGKYASIMYPMLMSASTYTNDYDYYQEELFSYGALGGITKNEDIVHVCDQTEVQ